MKMRNCQDALYTKRRRLAKCRGSDFSWQRDSECHSAGSILGMGISVVHQEVIDSTYHPFMPITLRTVHFL